MQHSEQARAVARASGADWDTYATEHAWSGVALGPVGQHRDSDAIERSNYRVILADLTERFGDAVSIASFGHWAVGWVEELTHDNGRDDVNAAVAEWRERLDSYPVADDDDYSATEWADNHPDDGRCYAEADTECPCGLPAA